MDLRPGKLCVQLSVVDSSTSYPEPPRSTVPMTDRSALTGTWNLDTAHTRLGFAAKHAMVTTVRGAFLDFEGSLTIDGEHPEQSSADVVIQAASFDSGNAQRDGHVRSADF